MATASITVPTKGRCGKIPTKHRLCTRNPVNASPCDSLDESAENLDFNAVSPPAMTKTTESTILPPPHEILCAQHSQSAVAKPCYRSTKPASQNQPTISARKTAPPKLVCRHASPTSIKKEIPVRPYNLKDYRQLRLNVKLGGLGPNIGPEQERIISGQKRLRDMVKQWNQSNKEKETSLISSKKIRKPLDTHKDRTPITSSKSADHALPSDHICHHGRFMTKRSNASSSRSLLTGSTKCNPIVLPVVRLKGFMKEDGPGKVSTKSDAKANTERKAKTGLDVLRKTREMNSLAEQQLSLLNSIMAKQSLEDC